MPAYDYHCPTCKSTYELRQGFDAPTTHSCEECGKGTAKRVLTPPTVVFKGAGWYATDSRKSTTAVSDSGEAKSDAAPDAKPAAPESKPASAGESAPAAPTAAAAS